MKTLFNFVYSILVGTIIVHILNDIMKLHSTSVLFWAFLFLFCTVAIVLYGVAFGVVLYFLPNIRLFVMEGLKKVLPYDGSTFFAKNHYYAGYHPLYMQTCGRGWREAGSATVYRIFSGNNQQKSLDNSLKVDRM